MTIDVTIAITHDLSDRAYTALEKLMATFDDLSAKIDALTGTAATIKSEIDDLKAQLAGGGMTPAEEQIISDKIDTLTTALNDAAAAGAPPTT